MKIFVTHKHKPRTWAALLTVLLLSFLPVHAQKVEFTASAGPNPVAVGERFRLTYSVNARAENFQPPDLNDFIVLSGPNISTSSSVQIINGRMTQTVSYSYNFVLQAQQEGKFTIGSAGIEVDGKSYTSNQVEMEVVAGSTQPQAVAPVPESAGSVQGAGDDLFIRVMVGRREVYQGEYLVATIKLYTRVDLSGLGKRQFPSFSGFLQQDIEIPEQSYLERETYNGQIYGTLVLRKLVLIPQRSGTLSIDPMELECLIRQRVRRGSGGFFDDFFDTFQTVSRTVKSEPIDIEVKPLPPGAPATFRGLVGAYTFESGLDPVSLSVNDAATLRINVRGKGNLRLIEPPVVNLPPDFESFDPKVSVEVNNTEAGPAGSAGFEYLLLPRSAGNFRIPPVEISYFNPASARYETWKSPAYNLEVAPAEEGEAGTVVTGFGKEDLRFIGRDIRFIRTGDIRWKKEGRDLTGKTWYYLMYPLIILVFTLLVWLQRRHVELRKNTELMRNRKANRQARKRLKLAAGAFEKNNLDQFYEEIGNACWGYLADKLSVPRSELNRDRIREQLMDREVPEDMINGCFDIIDHCERARYAGTDGPTEPAQVYRRALDLISGLEENLKQSS